MYYFYIVIITQILNNYLKTGLMTDIMYLIALFNDKS